MNQLGADLDMIIKKNQTPSMTSEVVIFGSHVSTG